MADQTQRIELKTEPSILRVIAWILLIMISFLFLVTFIHQKCYYLDSDVFYYVSIADSIRANGLFLDTTTDPPVPPKTPQNAVVLLNLLLSQFTASHELRLQILVIINYVALLISLYPLLKIAQKAGLESPWMQIVLGAVYLGGWHMMRFQLAPINDGLFRTGSLWLIWGILTLAESMSVPEGGYKNIKWLVTGLLLFSGLLIHFRLNGLIIPIAGCAAALFLKRKSVLWICVVMIVVMLLSLFAVYSCIELSRIHAEVDQSYRVFVSRLPQHIWNFFNHSLPSALFKDLGTTGNLLYAGFALAFLNSIWNGFRKKEFSSLFLVLICLGTFCFMILYLAAPYRMLMMVYPLMYILILNKPTLRSIGCLFVFSVLLQSYLYYHDGLGIPESTRFWMEASTKADFEEKAVLLTDKPRQAWYFINHSGRKDNQIDPSEVVSGADIYLCGSDDFVSSQKKKLELLVSENQYSLQYTSIIPNSSGFCFLKADIMAIE